MGEDTDRATSTTKGEDEGGKEKEAEEKKNTAAPMKPVVEDLGPAPAVPAVAGTE